MDIDYDKCADCGAPCQGNAFCTPCALKVEAMSEPPHLVFMRKLYNGQADPQTHGEHAMAKLLSDNPRGFKKELDDAHDEWLKKVAAAKSGVVAGEVEDASITKCLEIARQWHADRGIELPEGLK